METPPLTFEGQRTGENVILLRRQHPWTLWHAGLFAALVIAAIIMSVVFFGLSSVSSWVILGGGAVALGLGLYRWYNWWNTITILTNERVLLSLQSGFLSRAVSEVPLAKIQDVSFKVRGLWQTLYNYGVVIIKTASSDDVMRVENIAEPYQFQQELMKAAKLEWKGPHQT